MTRSPKPTRRRPGRGPVPVVVVLVLWIVVFLSVLGVAALLILRGMAVPAVVGSVTVLFTAAAAVSGTLTRSALTAARRG